MGTTNGKPSCDSNMCLLHWSSYTLAILKKSKLHKAGFQSPGKTGIFSQIRYIYKFQPEDSMLKLVLKYGNRDFRTISCINQHYSLALQLCLLHCSGMIVFENLTLFSWLYLNIILSVILSVLALSPGCYLFKYIFLQLLCLLLIHSVTSPAVLNTALQCCSALLFTLKQLFTLTCMPLTYKSERKVIRIPNNCSCCGPSCWLLLVLFLWLTWLLSVLFQVCFHNISNWFT